MPGFPCEVVEVKLASSAYPSSASSYEIESEIVRSLKKNMALVARAAPPARPWNWLCQVTGCVPLRGKARSATGGSSSQPALAALVALDALEALALTAAHAQAELFHVFVVVQI